MRLIVLNGPPRSGKDTIAKMLSDYHGATILKFTAPMDRAIPAFFGIDPQRWVALREDHKDHPAPEFNGLTPREVLISFSEEWAKRLFGRDIFGKLAAEEALRHGSRVVFSDGGFAREVTALRKKVPETFVVQVKRPGQCFENDSRQYLDNPDFVIDNNGSLLHLQNQVHQLAEAVWNCLSIALC